MWGPYGVSVEGVGKSKKCGGVLGVMRKGGEMRGKVKENVGEV